MDLPTEEPVVPVDDLINEALLHRAELVESRIDLNSRDLSNKAVRSARCCRRSIFLPTTAVPVWGVRKIRPISA